LIDQGLYAWLAAFWHEPPHVSPSPASGAGRGVPDAPPASELAALLASVLLHRSAKEVPS
jgi:hypothetical protein